MKPIEEARARLNAENAKGEESDFMRHVGKVLAAGVKLKAIMVEKGLAQAKAKCPLCGGEETLHGRLVTGPAAGRHRRSGGAFRMWCDTPNCAQMME